jgi:hypothetical protein
MRRDEHGREHGDRRERAEQIQTEPTRSHGVDEREEDRGDEEGARPQRRHDGRPAKAVAGVAEPSRPLLARPVGELGTEEKRRSDAGRGCVERRVGDGELDAVETTYNRNGDRYQGRPAEHDARDERKERDCTDPRAELLEGIATTRHRQREGRQQTGDTRDPRR